MTRGGSREGAGRRRLSEADRRKQLSCRVNDATFQWLSSERDRTSASVGEIIDLAVTVLQEMPARHLPEATVETEE
jgi:hypothetical protein